MRRFFAFAVLSVFAGGGGASALAAGVTQRRLMQVATELGRRYDTTYGMRNPAAMAMVYADDGVLISPAGPIVRGRKALEAYYAKRFASGARDHQIKVLEVHVMGDGGYGINAFSVMVPQEGGTMREEHGTIVAVYQHDPDAWRMSLVAPSVKETPAK
jgi:uncharacterized protein (TIGR02246 family)